MSGAAQISHYRRPGSYSAHIIEQIKIMFKCCADQPFAIIHFENMLCDEKFRRIDRNSGASRRVYVKGSVVVKVAYKTGGGGGTDQNEIEAKNTLNHPTLTPPLCAFLRSKEEDKKCGADDFEHYDDTGKFLSVLITRYTSRTYIDQYSSEFMKLRNTFQDCHNQNIGRIGKRLVALDTGYALAYKGRKM